MKALQSAFLELVNLVLPVQSFDGERAQTMGLDPVCWGRIRFISEIACDGCAVPFDFAGTLLCPACLGQPRQFDRARAACLYDEAGREPVLQFKYADRMELAPMLTSWLQRACDDLMDEVDAILPVPMHPWRLFRRRYNQAAELARLLARRCGKAYEPELLRRLRDTVSQTGRSATGRRRNVRGAFVPGSAAERYRGKTVLLVDDVLTTGATAEACAATLKQAGVARVYLGVISRVQLADSLPI